MSCKINETTEEPRVENTVPASLYESSSPELLTADEDKFILYGGGASYTFSLVHHQNIHMHPTFERAHGSLVTIYVLNFELLIWFDEVKKGIAFPYDRILLHGIQEFDETKHLYLQVEPSKYFRKHTDLPSESTPYIEIIITGPYITQRYDSLFNTGSNDVHGLYDAISICSALSSRWRTITESQAGLDDFSLTNENYSYIKLESTGTIGPFSVTTTGEARFHNYGDADDLEEDYDLLRAQGEDSLPIAGMNIDLGYSSTLRSIRKHAGDDLMISRKARKAN